MGSNMVSYVLRPKRVEICGIQESAHRFDVGKMTHD